MCQEKKMHTHTNKLHTDENLIWKDQGIKSQTIDLRQEQ